MIAEVVRAALGLPLRLVSLSRGLFQLALNTRPIPHYVLPVAGLDESKSHGILFALRQAAATEQVTLHRCLYAACVSSNLCWFG